MQKILVGADPELFLKNPNGGHFVSAVESDGTIRVPGTKYEPFKVPYGAIQVDGTALEFNIDPAESVEQFVHNIKSVRATLESYVPGFNVVAEPVAEYDPEYFMWDVPTSAQALGCDPDYCGWTLAQNPRPDPGSRPLRTASGHVHIGWTSGADIYDKEHFQLCGEVAKQMDYYLGIYSLLWDKDPTRRLLYGKAGAFRAKPYGMEYRVMSNRWLADERLMAWVYNSVQVGMSDFFSGAHAEDNHGDIARYIIDNNILEWQSHHPEIDMGLEKVPA